MRVRMDDNESTEIQMGPLMDMVFLLLIFFIVIAVTKKSIRELGIQLPAPTQAVAEVTPRDLDLVIRVTQDGDIWLGSENVGRQGLLDAVRAATPDTKVRFEVDHRAQVQHMMPIWDMLKHYGISNWGMRVQMEE